MSDATASPGFAPAGYDGWAVISLPAQTVVRANERGRELLGIQETALPIGLDEFLTTTDQALMQQRVLPQLRSGNQWQGALRLATTPIDATPSPVILIPHLGDDEHANLDFASLLFASADAPDASTLVTDQLTGMATRSALFRRLDAAVRRNKTSEHLLAAYFIDLDGLKRLNDRYGHEVGDTALIETAQRLEATLPHDALAVRFGGDEFVIIDERVRTLDDTLVFATKVLHALGRADDYHSISASIGIAVSRNGEVDAHELIRRADGAMYRAKAKGGAQASIFDAEMQSRRRSDEALRSSLLEAIANNGFGVAAQPIFELATGQIHGVELFIRVRDDTPYVADATQLFRLAHEYGEAFDAAVLGRALALSRVWAGSLESPVPRVHINISTQSLVASEFGRRVKEAVSKERISPRQIAFEIDAQDLATAGERERNTVDALQTLGIPLVIDGFGEGPLTLEGLSSWHPAMVKIAAANHNNQVLAGLVRATSTLRIPACIKGIGEHRHLEQVVAMGAFAGQGNALTPVRQIERINAQLRRPRRLGF